MVSAAGLGLLNVAGCWQCSSSSSAVQAGGAVVLVMLKHCPLRSGCQSALRLPRLLPSQLSRATPGAAVVQHQRHAGGGGWRRQDPVLGQAHAGGSWVCCAALAAGTSEALAISNHCCVTAPGTNHYAQLLAACFPLDPPATLNPSLHPAAAGDVL